MSDSTAAERYVAGRMSDAEAAEFEALMIERAEVAADVAVRQRFKLGLATLDERGDLQPLLKRAAPGWSRRYAAAAAAVVVLIAAGAYLSQRGMGVGGTDSMLMAQRDGANNLRVLSSHLLAQTRSQSSPPRITTPSGAGLLQMQLLVDAVTPADVNVVLSTGPAEDQTVLGAVHASRRGNGVVEVWLRTATLTAGVYRLTVSPLAGDGAAQSFEFEVGPG